MFNEKITVQNMSTELLLQTSFTSDDTINSEFGTLAFSNGDYEDHICEDEAFSNTIPVRTRHLSCIEENDTDSYGSLPLDFIKNADDSFKCLFDEKSVSWEAEDIDYITTLDETRILDIQSYEELEKISEEKNWTATTYGPLYQIFEPKDFDDYTNKQEYCETDNQSIPYLTKNVMESYPKIMTMSCYGALNAFDEGPTSLENDKLTPSDSCKVFMDSTDLQSSGPSENKIMTSSFGNKGTKAPDNILELSVTSADGCRFEWNDEPSSIKTIMTAAGTDLQAIRKLLDNDNTGLTCPNCQMLFDKGKKRKLIDACGHEICYSCMFRNEQCPLCLEISLEPKDDEANQLHGYDTGIGGSTTTIVSPLGSPQPQLKLQIRSKNNFIKVAQGRQNSLSPEPSRQCSSKQKQQKCLYFNTNRSCSEISTSSCATPPQNRRKIFNAKNIKSPFGISHRRSSSNGCVDTTTLSGSVSLETSTCSDSAITNQRRNIISCSNSGDIKSNRLSLAGTSAYAGHLSSLVFNKIKSLWSAHSSNTNAGLNQLADDERGNVKPLTLNRKGKASYQELQTRLGFFLENHAKKTTRNTIQSYGSLVSENTSPVSTLTGSAEAEVLRALQETNLNTDDVTSCMSLSLPNQNSGFSKPTQKRLSTSNSNSTTADASNLKNKKPGINRSTRILRPKESCEIRSRAAQYRLRQLTLKPLFFEVPLQEPDPLYVGRQWLLRELSNVLTTTETPGVLINGCPGTGKTALILQLVEYSCFGRRKEIPTLENDDIYSKINVGHDRLKALAAHVVAYHFCQADNNSTCLVPDFIHSLAAQLCQAPQLSAYREYLINEPHLQNILSIKECIVNPKRVMQMAILEPLTTLRRAGKIPAKNCVILVDALCEAEYHRPDHGFTIASFLSKMSEYFPSWLKVVATVRTQMLEFVKGLAYTKMTLDSWSSNEYLQKDMIEYITFRVNQSTNIQSNIGAARDMSTGQFKFITHLLHMSKGSFLYAKLILDLIERGSLVVKSTSYKILPVSLAQIFLLHFNLRFPTLSSFDKTSQILNVCLAALYPLTLSEIYYSLCALNVDEFVEWDDFVQRFKTLSGFLVKRIDNTYMFFHPSFREWLMRRDEGESSKFLCDFRLGHACIAFRLSRFQAPLNPEQTLELGHHILKAHIYRNSHPILSPRDIQSFWVSSVTESASAALCTLRNVYSPNIKVSRLLLLAGASPQYQTEFMGDATILCIAAYEGIVPMVSLLLEFGADVEKTNSQGCTPLILAALRGHCDVVRLLIAAGSSLGQVDTTQRCALVHASRMGKVSVVKYLLACDWVPRPNSSDVPLREGAQQSLIAASSEENITIVEDLLDMVEVDVNEIDSLCGETALTAAAKNGRSESVSIILSRGADVDMTNKKGWSPLLIAAKEGHWAVVEKLLQSGANIELTEVTTGKTSLIIAAEEGHVGIIELLIERGATLEKCDEEGLTALCWACLRGRLQAAKCLLEKGSNKNHSDKAGRTPLDLGAYHGSSGLVQLLLDRGAQMEHIDINGMRPLDRAIACRNTQVVQVFLKRGAKLGPATWAMAAGKTEIMVLLLNKLLEDGNILYRKNRFQDAAYRYQYALKKVPANDNATESFSIFASIKINLLLNLSRCKRKMNDHTEAIDLATQAINIKPCSYEGYYSRAKAHLEVNNFEEALNDSYLAIKKSSAATQEVKDTLKRLNETIKTKVHEEPESEQIDEITDL